MRKTYGVEMDLDYAGRRWLSQQVTLQFIAAHSAQELGLCCRLHPFGYHPQPEFVSNRWL